MSINKHSFGLQKTIKLPQKNILRSPIFLLRLNLDNCAEVPNHYGLPWPQFKIHFWMFHLTIVEKADSKPL